MSSITNVLCMVSSVLEALDEKWESFHWLFKANLSFAWFVAFVQGLGSTLFSKEKERQPCLHASWDHGNFWCQEFTTVSGLAACGRLKCWRVKEKKLNTVSWGGGHCPCFLPAVPMQRTLAMHLKVSIIGPFVRITNLTVLLLKQLHWGKSDPKNPVNPNKRKDCRWAGRIASTGLTITDSPVSDQILSFRWRLILQRFLSQTFH